MSWTNEGNINSFTFLLSLPFIHPHPTSAPMIIRLFWFICALRSFITLFLLFCSSLFAQWTKWMWTGEEWEQEQREQGKGPLSTGTGPVHLSHSSSVHSSLLRSPHCHSHRTYHSSLSLLFHSLWLTVLTAYRLTRFYGPVTSPMEPSCLTALSVLLLGWYNWLTPAIGLVTSPGKS